MSENTDNATTLTHKRYLIDIRRQKVLEYASQGLSQHEIGTKLNVSQSLVSLDLQYLKCQAAAAVNEYCTETIPFEFNKALTGLSIVVKDSFKISNDNTVDTRDKLAALGLVISAYEKRMELLTNSTLIDKVAESVFGMQQKVQNIQEEQRQTSEVF
jgi:hypothetical protein